MREKIINDICDIIDKIRKDYGNVFIADYFRITKEKIQIKIKRINKSNIEDLRSIISNTFCILNTIKFALKTEFKKNSRDCSLRIEDVYIYGNVLNSLILRIFNVKNEEIATIIIQA